MKKFWLGFVALAMIVFVLVGNTTAVFADTVATPVPQEISSYADLAPKGQLVIPPGQQFVVPESWDTLRLSEWRGLGDADVAPVIAFGDSLAKDRADRYGGLASDYVTQIWGEHPIPGFTARRACDQSFGNDQAILTAGESIGDAGCYTVLEYDITAILEKCTTCAATATCTPSAETAATTATTEATATLEATATPNAAAGSITETATTGPTATATATLTATPTGTATTPAPANDGWKWLIGIAALIIAGAVVYKMVHDINKDKPVPGPKTPAPTNPAPKAAATPAPVTTVAPASVTPAPASVTPAPASVTPAPASVTPAPAPKAAATTTAKPAPKAAPKAAATTTAAPAKSGNQTPKNAGSKSTSKP